MRYEKPTPEITGLIISMLKLHHKDLQKAHVKVDCLVVFAERDKEGNATGPALMCHGHEAAAICSITSLRYRARGLGDAEIRIDGDRWPDLEEPEQRSLMDHELEHLILREGTDSCGRPKLKLRRHDLVVGGFASIIERHGEASLEAQALIDLDKQLSFTWHTAAA